MCRYTSQITLEKNKLVLTKVADSTLFNSLDNRYKFTRYARDMMTAWPLGHAERGLSAARRSKLHQRHDGVRVIQMQVGVCTRANSYQLLA